jgi:pyruvate,water dikinase
MSLSKLLSHDLPVPGGFHVTTEAYRCFVAANRLQARILAELEGLVLVEGTAAADALETTSQRIRGFFAAGNTPTEISSAISEAYTGLRGAPVAVRSSATAEDLPEASFAGQQETYLNIRGVEAVLEAVKQCWASLWTARAISYRLKNGIDQEGVALAVVVQELVSAEAAGILFTANPVNGKRDELVINAAWGLGEAVVSGAVTPDTLTVKKETGKVLQRETAEKALMTVRTQTGTAEVPVPDPQKKKAVLSGAQAAELAGLGVRIEGYYGQPMDVEWALAGGKFYILQARPITALPLEWKAPEQKAIFARGSLAEHIPSPVTPLFATLGLEIANEATAQLWERIVGEGSQNLTPEGGMYHAINGYVFGGIRMGGKNTLKIIRMSTSQIGPMFRGSVERWQAARRELAAVVEEWEHKPAEDLRPTELLEGVRVLFRAACRYFTHIQTTLPAASSSEVLFTRLYNSLIRRKEDPAATTFLLGFDTVALQAEKSLFDIAEWVRTEPALEAYASQTPAEQLKADFLEDIQPEGLSAELWAEWRLRFGRHLEEFGRTAYEFDFANPTPQEDPRPMLDAIQAFLSGKAGDPYLRQRESAGKREAATNAVLARTGWPRRNWFQRLLRWVQETAPMRENSIYDMGMGHPAIRRFLAELGRRFAGGGAIQQADDIYWLEKEEVEELISALEQGLPLSDFSERIPSRREDWQSALKAVPPVMLPEKSGWSRLIHGAEAESKDGKVVLKGVGTSGGLVTAPACVLYGPEDFGKLNPGDVLVAVTTTPAWTPLFALAGAVVTDIGGPLSHSSIVAREYGIPAVMAARTATRSIQTGQIVTVDGTAGTVTVDR